jgi:glutamine synthetase
MSLRESVGIFRQSEFAKRAFGADVVEHYAHFYDSEVQAFDKAVTDWERQRYFEQI